MASIGTLASRVKIFFTESLGSCLNFIWESGVDGDAQLRKPTWIALPSGFDRPPRFISSLMVFISIMIRRRCHDGTAGKVLNAHADPDARDHGCSGTMRRRANSVDALLRGRPRLW